MLCVFDTNILISATLFNNSIPGKALNLVLSKGRVLASIATIEELTEVIHRRKFDKYLTNREREEFVESFLMKVLLVEINSDIKTCRDSKDNKFLNTAISGNADYIVTGDQDLLSIEQYCDINILSPRMFIAALTPQMNL